MYRERSGVQRWLWPAAIDGHQQKPLVFTLPPGVVICRAKPLDELVRCSATTTASITQYFMKDVELMGLLKEWDFLGSAQPHHDRRKNH